MSLSVITGQSPAMDRAFAEIDRQFGWSAVHDNFKRSIRRLIRLGAGHPDPEDHGQAFFILGDDIKTVEVNTADMRRPVLGGKGIHERLGLFP